MKLLEPQNQRRNPPKRCVLSLHLIQKLLLSSSAVDCLLPEEHSLTHLSWLTIDFSHLCLLNGPLVFTVFSFKYHLGPQTTRTHLPSQTLKGRPSNLPWILSPKLQSSQGKDVRLDLRLQALSPALFPGWFPPGLG